MIKTLLPLILAFLTANVLSAEGPEVRERDAYLLISSSIPEASRLALAKASADLGLPLVFKGLAIKSVRPFKGAKQLGKVDWAQARPILEPLILKGASIVVDPVPFETFRIDRVPTLVLKTPEETVLFSGDIPLKSALEVVAARAKTKAARDFAKTLLSRESGQ